MLKIVCENGITIEELDGKWNLLSTKTQKLLNNPEEFLNTLKIRPVLLETEKQNFIFLKGAPSTLLELQPLNLSQLVFSGALMVDLAKINLTHSINMNYVVGAVVYHCKRLAILYSQITQEYPKSVNLHNENDPSDPYSEQFWASNRPAPFYEIEALITSGKRAFESMRYVIWNDIGKNRTHPPKGFFTTLNQCNNLPNPLKTRLAHSWENFGKKVSNYRDCIQHNFPMSKGWSNLKMDRLKGGIWKCSALLPDKGNAASPDLFTYNLEIDGLTYGWELTNEIIEIANHILASSLKTP